MKFYQELRNLRLSKYELRKYVNKLLFLKKYNLDYENVKKKLVDNYLALGLKLATKYQSGSNMNTMELFNEAYIAINKAVDKYDGRSSLSTFVHHYIKWHLQTYISENSISIKLPFKERKKYKESLDYLFISEILIDKYHDGDDYEKIKIKEMLLLNLNKVLEQLCSNDELDKLFNDSNPPKELLEKLRKCEEVKKIYDELKSL
jgi:RNA polymerase sigma factor (sigma-70 family)